MVDTPPTVEQAALLVLRDMAIQFERLAQDARNLSRLVAALEPPPDGGTPVTRELRVISGRQ